MSRIFTEQKSNVNNGPYFWFFAFGLCLCIYLKSGELWSTSFKELDVSLNPPKLHFSGGYISALGGSGPQILTRTTD